MNKRELVAAIAKDVYKRQGVVEMVYNRGAGCVNIRLLAYQISYKKDMI